MNRQEKIRRAAILAREWMEDLEVSDIPATLPQEHQAGFWLVLAELRDALGLEGGGK